MSTPAQLNESEDESDENVGIQSDNESGSQISAYIRSNSTFEFIVLSSGLSSSHLPEKIRKICGQMSPRRGRSQRRRRSQLYI